MYLKRTLAALVVAAMLPQAAPAQQAEPPTPWRAKVFPVVGAVTFAGLASLAESGHEGAFCADRGCLMTVGGVAGGIIGFLLGSDLDEKAAARWTPAARLTVQRGSGSVPRTTLRLAPHPGGVAALSGDGVVLLTPTLSTRVLLADRGVRDAAAVDGALLAVADSAIVAVPLEGGAADTVLVAIATSIAAADDGVVLAGRDRLERGRLTGGAANLEWSRQREGSLTGVPQALATGAGGAVWMALDTLLQSHDGATLAALGRLPLGAYAQDLEVVGGTGAVALGAAGVAVVDLTDPARPREVTRLTDARASLAVAASGDELYVAAGGQGLFVYRLAGGSATLAGVVADLGLITDVEADGRYVWALDQRGARVVRLEPAGALAGAAAR